MNLFRRARPGQPAALLLHLEVHDLRHKNSTGVKCPRPWSRLLDIESIDCDRFSACVPQNILATAASPL